MSKFSKRPCDSNYQRVNLGEEKVFILFKISEQGPALSRETYVFSGRVPINRALPGWFEDFQGVRGTVICK